MMSEQPSSHSSERPPLPFKLVEKPADGKMREVAINSVESVERVELDAIMDGWIDLVEQGRSAVSRVPEAAIQNRLLRGLVTGSLKPEALKRLPRAFAQRAAARGFATFPIIRSDREKLVTTQVKPLEYAEINVQGALTAAADVKRLREGFDADRRGGRLPPTWRQMLGTHDRLDAEQGIDLVEVVFDIMQGKDAVQSLAFIQSKGKGISDADLERLHEAHLAYARRLATVGEASVAEAQKILKEAAKLERLVGDERDPVDQLMDIDDKLEPLVFALATERDMAFTDEGIEAALRAAGSRLLVGSLKGFLRSPERLERFLGPTSLKAIDLGVADDEGYRAARANLHRWAQSPISARHALEVAGPDAFRDLQRIPKISSVVLHGKERSERTLETGTDRKVLTKSA